jgi:hypothetical protein
MVTQSHKFHRASRLPPRKTQIQKKYQLKKRQEAKEQIESLLEENVRRATQGTTHMDKDDSPKLAEDYSAHIHGYNGPTYWVDVETALDEESNRTLAQIRLLYQTLKQNQKQSNWSNLFKSLFPVYTHLKRITNNWTSRDALDDRSLEVCNCQDPNPVVRQVDLIDLFHLIHI